MKKRKWPGLILVLLLSVLFSCKKTTQDYVPNTPIKPTNAVPVANAGADKTIILPEDSVVLDGSMSTDDGTITSYEWIRLSGPSDPFIEHADSVRVVVKNLIQGIYEFQLTVTDVGLIKDQDTIRVTVIKPDPSHYTILVNETGTLQDARAPSVAAAGSKIVFAGGANRFDNPGSFSNTSPSSAVDIYDINTRVWTTAQLSAPRQHIGAVSNGNKIFFAGGSTHEIYFNDGRVYSNVDIYDVSTNSWSLEHLSVARANVAAASLGNKVFFAGGSPDGWNASSRVDIYDLTTNTWSTAELTHAKYFIDVVTNGDRVYFVGGEDADISYNSIDIYDISTNSWSTSTLEAPFLGIKDVTAGGIKYWIYYTNDLVKIMNMATGLFVAEHSLPAYFFRVFEKNGHIVFGVESLPSFQGDLNPLFSFNPATGEWRTGSLNRSISSSAALISFHNSVYAAGGNIGDHTFSDQVYSLDW